MRKILLTTSDMYSWSEEKKDLFIRSLFGLICSHVPEEKIADILDIYDLKYTISGDSE